MTATTQIQRRPTMKTRFRLYGKTLKVKRIRKVKGENHYDLLDVAEKSKFPVEYVLTDTNIRGYESMGMNIFEGAK